MRRVVVVGAAMFLCVWAPAIPALAHTEFDSSNPTDGEIVVRPVDEIVVVFTLPVTIVGAGFEVLDPGGEILSPRVETEDDMSFRLVLPGPMDGGDVAVRYEVAAEDGHVLAGGFSFTVSVPVSTTTTVEAETTTSGSQPDPTTSQPSESMTSSTSLAVANSNAGPAGDDDGAVPWLLLFGGLLLVAGAGFYAWHSLRS